MNSLEAISGLVAPREASVAIWASGGGEFVAGLGTALAGGFPGGDELEPGPFGEAGRAHRFEQGVGGAQLLPGLGATLAPAQPFTV